MKLLLKIIAVLFCILVFLVGVLFAFNMSSNESGIQVEETAETSETDVQVEEEIYTVVAPSYTYDYDNFDNAKEVANKSPNAYITHNDEVVWVKDALFTVYVDNEETNSYNNYAKAVAYAKNFDNSDVFYKTSSSSVFSTKEVVPTHYMIDNTPIISMGSMQSGSSVASINMILKKLGKKTTNENLAEQMIKDKTPLKKKNGLLTYGNPYKGFVGDIYSSDVYDGYVYVEPMYDLLKKQLPNNAINLTGSEFDDLKRFISADIPVIVVTNSSFQTLTENDFLSWYNDGTEIFVPKNLMTVVVVGYDDEYVYINNPQNGKEKQKIDKTSFTGSFTQLNNQCMAYVR